MTFAATADVEHFDEAVAWFALRFPVTDELLAELGVYAGERAWTISAVTHLDAVLAAHEILTNAIETGAVIEETMVALGAALEPYGFSGHRLETIIRTNSSLAYNAGRYQQLIDPDLLAVRPFRQFDGIGDFRQTEICNERDGVTLPALDPWWLANWPPLHFMCRSQVRSLAAWEAEDADADMRVVPILPPTAEAQNGFGLAPDVAAPWQPELSTYPPELAETYAAGREDFIRSTTEGSA